MMSRLFRIPVLFLVVLFVLSGADAAGSGSGYEYRIREDGSAVITGYRGSDADLVFPESIDGHTVSGLSGSFCIWTVSVKNIRTISIPKTMTAIQPGALQFASYLTEIRIPADHPCLLFSDGVLYDTEKKSLLLYLQSSTAEHLDVPDGIREIEDRAFFRSNLVSVSLPGSVERIGRESFYQCTALRDVELSEGLKTIEADAFTNCDKLREIEIPASVTDIAEAVFTDAHLKEIRVAPGNEVFTVSDGALINTRDGVLIAFPHFSEAESCVIPQEVTRIGRLAFYRCHNLKRVTFPEGLREIGHSAFLLCNHLAEINIPDSVMKVEDLAFGTNSDTERLRLPAGLTEIVNNFDDLAITELTIPDTVTKIEKSFTSLPKLTEAVIPGSVTVIGDRCFAYCRNLARITIPASVTEIRSMFTGCAETLVIRVEPDSYAEAFCREHRLTYEYISD